MYTCVSPNSCTSGHLCTCPWAGLSTLCSCSEHASMHLQFEGSWESECVCRIVKV